MLSKRRLSPWFLVALLVLLGAVAFRVVGVFLSYVLFGLFLAYLTHPVYRWLLARLKRPAIAASVLLTVIFVLIIVPLVFLAAELVAEIQSVVASLGLADPQAILDALSLRINELLGLPPADTTATSGVVNDVFNSVQDALTRWVRALPTHLAESLIGLFLLVYVLYYTYVDGERAMAALRDALPMQPAHRDLLFDEVGHVIRGVMYGTVLMSLLQAALALIGFSVFGVPNALFWSVLVFILALLPIVGAPIIWVPWSLYLIYQGETFRGAGLLIYSAILVNGIEHLIRPKLIGSVANIHPLVVLLGVVGGLAVFGFIGFILGPLVLSVFLTVFNLYRKEFAGKLDEPIGPVNGL